MARYPYFAMTKFTKLALGFTLTAAICSCRPVTAVESSAVPSQPGGPCLHLDTAEGEIAIRLDRSAAPAAVAAIERLAAGPLYAADLLPRPEAASAVGYFDDLDFDYARPRLELRLANREPAAAFTVEAELDAAAFGLDAARVADAGEAMNLLQFELLPALKRAGAERVATPALAAWAERFETGGYDASFLIGVSRQEVLEAIGYRFHDGLASRPAVRGAVALVPVSPTEAKLSLSILLADHPQRTGRWVVVGEVASGLELADAIALRPLALPARRDNRPLYPVTVRQARLTAACNPRLEGVQP